jgi:hypothetical protein
LKLAPLLSQYLYTHKRLDLPGIGTFMFEPPVPGEEGGKHGKVNIAEGISFESNTAIKEAPELINFISSQAGKMKALASADLNSHLDLAQEFLNIGKPFLFEGIGSLVKIKPGQYAFTPGQIMSEKVKEFSMRESSATSSSENSFTDYQNIFYSQKTKTRWKKPLLVVLLLTGVALAIWGGYTVYKKTTTKDQVTTEDIKKEETIPVTITTPALPEKKDSLPVITQQPPAAGDYKFVVEVANKERALDRFSTLKGWGLSIQMETKDSADFQLFFLLPASASDTARIVDSLGNLYTPSWKKAFAEAR